MFLSRKEKKVMNGKDVKKLLRDKQIRQWQLASELNVSESTILRWLRGNVSKAHETAILEAITKLSQRS